MLVFLISLGSCVDLLLMAHSRPPQVSAAALQQGQRVALAFAGDCHFMQVLLPWHSKQIFLRLPVVTVLWHQFCICIASYYYTRQPDG